MPIRCCKECDYSTKIKSSYDKHLLSTRHVINTTDAPNTGVFVFECVDCRYGTDDSTSYSIHCSTKRHKKLMGETDWKCACGEFFHSSKALTFHEKKCVYEPPLPPPPSEAAPLPPVPSDAATVPVDSLNTILKLLEKKDMQLETLMEKVQSQSYAHHNTNSLNTNNIDTQNNFNINIFLDEHCKNALDLDSFINKIQVVASDLDTLKLSKNPKAINEIFAREIGKLSITERPLHCTDTKRKKIYVKNQGEWGEDADGKELNRALDAVGERQWGEMQNQFRALNNDFQSTDATYIAEIAGIISTASGPRDAQERMNAACKACHLSKQSMQLCGDE